MLHTCTNKFLFGSLCRVGNFQDGSVSSGAQLITSTDFIVVCMRQSVGKISMVIAMVALLASVAYFYQKMDAGRTSSKGGGSSKADVSAGIALQSQINDVSSFPSALQSTSIMRIPARICASAHVRMRGCVQGHVRCRCRCRIHFSTRVYA